LLGGDRRVTVAVEERNANGWVVSVCAEMRTPLDLGINMRQLALLRERLEAHGYEIDAGPIATSWRRSSRP
jgi:hypothetical protein